VVPSVAVMIGRWMVRGDHRGDPGVAVLGVLRERDAGRAALGRAGDVPRLEPHPVEDVGELGRGRRVVEVAAHGVADPGGVQLGGGGAALAAGGIDPDLELVGHA
jgi:hypothetical protein